MTTKSVNASVPEPVTFTAEVGLSLQGDGDYVPWAHFIRDEGHDIGGDSTLRGRDGTVGLAKRYSFETSDPAIIARLRELADRGYEGLREVK